MWNHNYQSVPNDSVALSRPYSLFGINVLHHLHRDAWILFITKIFRMFSFGFLAVMLVTYLEALEYTKRNIGLLFSLTLGGDALISLLMTSHADLFGRRKVLVLGSIVSVITSIIFTTQREFTILLVAGILGVISPSGNEVGPFMAIELSALSQVSKDSDRTKLMAWYNLVGCFASAMGALFCGFMISILHGNHFKYSLLDSYRLVMAIYTIFQIILCYLFSNLSSSCEVPSISRTTKDSNPVKLFLGLHKSRDIVIKLSCLFMLDAFAGTFVLQSFICSWFDQKYHTDPKVLGSMIFICNIVAGVSALFAAKLAEMIGLILTMGLTHLPSNILLILIPIMPNEIASIFMLCARYSISQMDVPTRNAYVQGVVSPEERSAAAGITNVVRSIGGALGPYIAGLLYANTIYSNYPFYIAGGLKILYDVILMLSFISVKPPEEQNKNRFVEVNVKPPTQVSLLVEHKTFH